MNKPLTVLLILIWALFLAFIWIGIVGFIYWDLNASAWPEGGRVVFVCLWAISLIISIGAYLDD